MKNNTDIGELIANYMTLLMDRTISLDTKDQRAIGKEFTEWLKEVWLDKLLTISKN